MEKIKIYLAGPEVFLRDAIEQGNKKKDLCARDVARHFTSASF